MVNKSICLFLVAFIFSTTSFAQTFKDSVVQIKDTTSQNFLMDGTDTVFTKVEQFATFPGGMDGWRRYLERNLHYPRQAQKKSLQGMVRMQMVVTKDGIVTDVKILSEPGGGLGEEAVRVIKEGPKWISAEQNGRKVNYRFVQTITFQLQ